MEKLRLDVEELRVQSFVPDEADGLKGTVQGQEGPGPSALLSHCCHTDEYQSCPARCTP
jgi:hypothetical protein